jgi:uncharacterized membrane protein YgdD (TMEM256/DUF423 family)
MMSTISRRWIAIGALLAAIGVAFGACSAHGLRPILENLGYTGEDLYHRLTIFETAVRYQLFHSIALILVGLALQNHESKCWRFSAWAFLVGIILFCGLLKVLAFAGSDWRPLGHIVPFGGASMIAGWIAFAVGALRCGTTSAQT